MLIQISNGRARNKANETDGCLAKPRWDTRQWAQAIILSYPHLLFSNLGAWARLRAVRAVNKCVMWGSDCKMRDSAERATGSPLCTNTDQPTALPGPAGALTFIQDCNILDSLVTASHSNPEGPSRTQEQGYVLTEPTTVVKTRTPNRLTVNWGQWRAGKQISAGSRPTLLGMCIPLQLII